MASFRRPIDEDELRRVKDDIHGKFSNTVDTICDHIREVYRAAHKIENATIREQIENECITIMVYAKRMASKLVELNNNRGMTL